MRRAERLFEIIAHLREGKPVTAAAMAALHEVSERTIYRDIAHLQGCGVAIDGVPGMGYVANVALNLPSLNFSLDELDALAFGLSYAMTVGDTNITRAAQSSLRKIRDVQPDIGKQQLDQDTLTVRRRASARAPRFTLILRRAIRDHQMCEIDYVNIQGKPTTREISPFALVAFSDGWIVRARCGLRQQHRDFRVDRIKAIRQVVQSS